ncbi:MAG: D-aminoacyl-tRNA deacylase [Gammaproteobacteria bacterium]|nr:D-aminoacyl-tRNA deacylase [Gammaproteobacteria bacterium]MDH5727525.1 D-aminoacyl-tRNA deacylase [Gammaproteobacteria bacterium]
MIGLLQRVDYAKVEVNQTIVGQIDAGLLVLVGIEKSDNFKQAQRLIDRLLAYRVFEDSNGRMNLSVKDIEGGLLLVPQFTLVADTAKGNRPSFSAAAPPVMAQTLFQQMYEYAMVCYTNVAAGRFGADMRVSLCNNGPVTFKLQIN